MVGIVTRYGRHGQSGVRWENYRLVKKVLGVGEDVAALLPPLIMCVAFLVGVGWFLRREMAPRRRRRAAASGLEGDGSRASGDPEPEASPRAERGEDA
jgi:hypothetical protein